MKAAGARVRGMSVRSKLLLLAGGPVFVTGAVLLALFIWSHEASFRAYEHALTWEHHARALQNLNWATRFYVDSVADRIATEPLPHEVEAKKALERARAEALSLSRLFSVQEQAAQEQLDAHLGELIDEGERVGKDRGRLEALAARYQTLVNEEIRGRLQEEEAGSARAIQAAHELSDAVRAGGFAVALLALLTAVGVSVVAIGRFGGRVAFLQQAAGRVAAGDLEGDVPITSGDELGQLAGSLSAMVEALRRQRTRQLGLLAAVAHDLRNPLAAMRVSAEALLQAAELPPEPSLRKSLTLISRQIDRLGRLADDLLDAASIEAGQLTLKPRACDLAAVAREVTELYAETSTRHELRLTVPSEPVVAVCDPTRIAQVLDNLVNNAIKYSPAGGTVEVSLATDAEEVVVSVADTGVGIEAGMSEAIFQPFRRLSPTKDVLPGVGLGLSTCRRIVVAHGGRIDVTSKIGSGTKFRVHLPRQAAPRWRP